MLEWRNPSLGLVTKARAYKVASQKWAWESHFMILRVQKSVREWTLTLPSELPLWKLESQWTPGSSESYCRGQSNWIETFLISLEISWNLDV